MFLFFHCRRPTLRREITQPIEWRQELARKLEEFPTAASRRYPWDEWLNGDVWQLDRGDDYSAKTTTVMSNARARARQMGGVVRTRTVTADGRESIIVQFLKDA
jgi:hypothetical protein